MKKFLLVILLITIVKTVPAQDRVFAYTYQSNVLPGGAMEMEYWTTLRSGRTHFYNAIDQRLELELGLGHRLQTAFYLNLNSTTYSPTDSFMLHDQSLGFSTEWKYKITDPVANAIGSALYIEAGFNGQELELEGKLILDKQIGKHLVAANFVGEVELEYTAKDGNVAHETETPFELDLSYMYMLGKHAGLGVEIRNHNVVEEREWMNSAWFAGPTLHFHGDRWFINLNIQPQLFNARKEAGVTDKLELNDHEKVETRLLVSFSF